MEDVFKLGQNKGGGKTSSYWLQGRNKKGYERLNPGSARKRKTSTVELASSAAPRRGQRRGFSWRIKLTHRLKLIKLRRFSPKKFVLGLRDAYVNMMMRIANTRMIGTGFGATRPGIKEYDERMIVEIYKSILMAQQQKGRDGPCCSRITNNGAQIITCSR